MFYISFEVNQKINKTMKIQTILSIVFLTFSIVSCSSWSDKDSEQYMEYCTTKLSKEYCECTLNKVKSEFSNWDDIYQNQERMAEILVDESCLQQE